MTRGRRRIEVSTDIQPLGGHSRRYREEKKREGGEKKESIRGGRERLEKLRTERTKEMEQEETEDGTTEQRARTDTDVESTESRKKKGQMKSIFLSDSVKEAIVDFCEAECRTVQDSCKI